MITKWWIDGAFAVLLDMKNQSGVVISLRTGKIYNSSQRQKLDTTSSTVAELMAVSNSMLQILWTNYCLKGQGFDSLNTTLFQNNQPVISLENIVDFQVHTEHIT